MQELRILSGYHRGATLPLEGRALSIGADEEADVVLADPGLAGRHARLTPDGNNWLLEPLDGTLRGESDNVEQMRILLGERECARVGAVWITVCAPGDPWRDPPPEPADIPVPAGEPATEAVAESVADSVAEAATQDDSWLQDERARFDQAAAEDATPPPPDTAPARRTRGSRVILVPLTAMAVLSAAAAYGWTAHPADPRARIAASASAPVPVLRPPGEAPRTLTADQLQAALRKRLGEVDLLSRVTLELGPRAWVIRGALNDEESERLQRMLRTFAQRHVLDVPVHVRVGSPESMLPFRIQQVLAGDDPCIITDDGRRLYVGDEYRGVRLASVAGNQLRFTGRHELDVLW